MKPKYFLLLPSLIAILLSFGCFSDGDVDDVVKATVERYREMEIREYQGANLDPAIGPYDNSIKGVQTVDMGSYRLTISGLVDRNLELTYDDILELDPYERLITLYCVTGWDATILWKGVLIEDIMDLAGIQSGANTVIFHSVDGYTTSLPLEQIQQNDLILAYSSNGLDLPAELGYPFMVVAEDKLGYKWARWVQEIELSDDSNYKGYWESRGYDNEADVER
ncbi:molybdopterin-dependent oxidoreductase [Alkalibacter rhizosphaerae]|uniref:Molybdopterin-dependent oxidoreductase n=1 Tax=Alkalibacter rhizosphaerae TaxID=2815577 RepID=A0A975AGS6_9FIRM|nr:molybdopterin-dependent oxidoreductase [Alkalibacter rhizosphaerae]QSX07687.1 molybdopterin-dependent oxidoreductase [Alkalibacter rhizosphaerae]